ncbi:DUF998 domain-containing protein [Oleiagrimonas sp. MCCC 1A03011]|uniref:DUF998 domain-containing protein n=1 Tax=Oleiagrimonas sp. MCCC 1A03011 TaxID=1926883 RepID=UPI000DC55D94|nr:DUF998 domain-containing protein [Oleiagrimonas sp. MCCC 1A03011]RAP56115.1 hypothetical protein BTJ49_14375 [Oleiagrimonas sp. MCCC 1A03011]
MMRASMRRTAGFVLAAVASFAAVCAAAQVLRTDLDWVRVPLSFYLIGPGSGWVRAAYVLLALALPVFGWSAYRALSLPARSAAPLLLFTVAGIALCVTTFATTNTYAHPATFHGLIHGIAAQTTFLCVTVAMLLQAGRLRHDARWCPYAARALTWAAVSFVGLWVQVLWRGAPHGLSQKLLIVFILGWLAWMAWLLWRKSAEVIPSTH